jgi:hypothetical protein
MPKNQTESKPARDEQPSDEGLSSSGLFCVFHGRGGYDCERESANKDLEVGKQYQVVDVEMHASVTYITLEGWKHSYNTAMFDVDHGDLYEWAHLPQNETSPSVGEKEK